MYNTALHASRSGAVAAVQQVKNPITLARAVMEKTDHCLLVAEGASMRHHHGAAARCSASHAV